MMKKSILPALLVIVLLFPASCTKDSGMKKIRFMGEAQGTYYMVTYFANDTLVTQNQIDSLLRDFDMSASIWVKNSIITRINNSDPSVIPDKHFTDIFKLAQRVSKVSDGAFDITVGPLVNAWGFGFKNKMNMNDHIVDSLLPLVDYEAVKLVNGMIIKENPDIQIDYNAIAQGYSVDLAGGLLEKYGIENYLVDIGGEVFARGSKPDGSSWVVGIEKPSEDINSGRQLNATIKISDKAVATSGSYRKYYEVDGVRYSHTIDPKTGYPVRHSLLSATVMADSAAVADAYATAFMVMGIEKAKQFIDKNPDIEAYFIYSDTSGNLKVFKTKNLENLIEEQ